MLKGTALCSPKQGTTTETPACPLPSMYGCTHMMCLFAVMNAVRRGRCSVSGELKWRMRWCERQCDECCVGEHLRGVSFSQELDCDASSIRQCPARARLF